MSTTQDLPTERRTRRSHDTVTALHYQLAHVRSRVGLDCVVLVDDRGCLLAGAGAWPRCEELAAYAPLLAQPEEIRWTSVGTRIAEMSSEVEVRPFAVGASTVLLCSRAGGATREVVGPALDRATAGVRRILAG